MSGVLANNILKFVACETPETRLLHDVVHHHHGRPHQLLAPMSDRIEIDSSSPQALLTFYRRLYPFKSLFNWLNHEPVPTRRFTHREFAFTLQGDIYIRYYSFANAEELKKQIVQLNPSRFEIGAVYSARVCVLSCLDTLAFTQFVMSLAPRQEDVTTRNTSTRTTRTRIRYRHDRLRRNPYLLLWKGDLQAMLGIHRCSCQGPRQRASRTVWV